MKFNIVGADQETGEDIEMTVEASDESAAQEVAHRKGIMVSHVTAVEIARPAVPQRAAPHRRVEQGHYRNAPVVNIAPPRRGNSLGVASLILGTLAFLICWIPLVNLLGVPLSALGLILGVVGFIVALTRNGASIGFPIAGSAICGLALFVALSMTGAFVGGLQSASQQILKDAERRNATNQTSPTIGATTAPPTTPAATPNPEEQWASGALPVKQGDVQVKLRLVRVGKASLKHPLREGINESKDDLLIIELYVSNVGDTKKIEYRTWRDTDFSLVSRVAVSDNFGNSYKGVTFGSMSSVIGGVTVESIYPGKSVQDILVFEQPIAKAEYLNLELPASNFGGEGMLRIRIPKSMIHR